jgi:hypothetical protein
MLKNSSESLLQRIKTILIDLSCNHITDRSILEVTAKEVLSPESMLYLCSGNWIHNQQLIEETREAFREYEAEGSVSKGKRDIRP